MIYLLYIFITKKVIYLLQKVIDVNICLIPIIYICIYTEFNF